MSRPTCSSSKPHTVSVAIPHDEPHPGAQASPRLGGQRRSLTGVPTPIAGPLHRVPVMTALRLRRGVTAVPVLLHRCPPNSGPGPPSRCLIALCLIVRLFLSIVDDDENRCLPGFGGR